MGQMMPYSTLTENDFSISWYRRRSKHNFLLLQLGSRKTESIHCNKRRLLGLLRNSNVRERFQVRFIRCI